MNDCNHERLVHANGSLVCLACGAEWHKDPSDDYVRKNASASEAFAAARELAKRIDPDLTARKSTVEQLTYPMLDEETGKK